MAKCSRCPPINGRGCGLLAQEREGGALYAGGLGRSFASGGALSCRSGPRHLVHSPGPSKRACHLAARLSSIPFARSRVRRQAAELNAEDNFWNSLGTPHQPIDEIVEVSAQHLTTAS